MPADPREEGRGSILRAAQPTADPSGRDNARPQEEEQRSRAQPRAAAADSRGSRAPRPSRPRLLRAPARAGGRSAATTTPPGSEIAGGDSGGGSAPHPAPAATPERPRWPG